MDKLDASCTCPYDLEGICKHIVALMYEISKQSSEGKQNNMNLEMASIIDKVSNDKIKEFLLNVFRQYPDLLTDFKALASVDSDFQKSYLDYQDEILELLEDINEDDMNYDYSQDYDYDNSVNDILNEYIDNAMEYFKKARYAEAIMLYQGICSACLQCIANERFENFDIDVGYYVEKSIDGIIKCLSHMELDFEGQRQYIDFFMDLYKNHSKHYRFEKSFFNLLYSDAQVAQYALSSGVFDSAPHVRFHLLLALDNSTEIISYGQRHYKECPEIALPLAKYYAKMKEESQAIMVAETALNLLQEFRYSFSVIDLSLDLSYFLNQHYNKQQDYQKIVQNLQRIITLSKDLNYYKELKNLLKTEEERLDVFNNLEIQFQRDKEFLFKLYSIENRHEKLLNLARGLNVSVDSYFSDLFHNIISKISDIYPDECFALYQGKIDKFLVSPQTRKEYRMCAYWLKKMKEIKSTQERFQKYISNIRETYKKRPALIEEIKGV